MSDQQQTNKIMGYNALRQQSTNKSTAFTEEERRELKLKGLLPYKKSNQDEQTKRALIHMRRKHDDLEKYIFLTALHNRNEHLFFKVVMENIEEIMPLIYTPTVGQACKEFADIFRETKGFYITPEDKGQIKEMLDNWPEKKVKVIVITDGERILGLGDLGANGMGIPIGKLCLYVACAGVQPDECMPVMLDVGTNNKELREASTYLGYPKERIAKEIANELIEEFVTAVNDRFPDALIQFEDFSTLRAYELLNIYKEKTLSFNDDIQGTAAVTVAGVYAYSRLTKIPIQDLKILFMGAGSASTGIADLMKSAFIESGLSEEEAIKRLWLMDSKGLIVKSRTNLNEKPHAIPYAQDVKGMDFINAIKEHKPHIVIGATGHPGGFAEEVIRLMSEQHERPGVFALSNPTSRAECTAEQAYTWSEGRAVFASGSPFSPVKYGNKTFVPGQGNNAYIFPGVGLGAIACKALKITDEMFLASTKALAKSVTEENLSRGTLFPPLTDIRKVSLEIATDVANKAYEQNLARLDRPSDLKEYIKGLMYSPDY